MAPVLRELTSDNTTYVSNLDKHYRFNTADNVNGLLLDVLLGTGQLSTETEYDLDFDHQFLGTERYQYQQR